MHLPVAAHIEIWLWVALQVALIIFAVRLYRARRTPPLRLLMWACIVYSFAGLSWYVLYAIRFVIRQPIFPERHIWQAYSDRAFHVLFMLLMLLCFRSFVRESRRADTRDGVTK